MIDNAIGYEVDARGIATITLNRPQVHNAFNDEVVARLTTLFREAETDPSVRLLVLAATGPSFCAGGDLNWMQRMATYTHDENRCDALAISNMLDALNTLPKPTVARIQGPAYGGGVGLVCCCDIALATPEARFCLSEVRIGMIPATIAPYVVRAIGQRAARRYFTTAEVISAQQAVSLGLVSELVSVRELDQRIDEIADQVMLNGPAAMADAKRLAFDMSEQPLTPSMREQAAERLAIVRGRDEGREGLSAFLQKRKPEWAA